MKRWLVLAALLGCGKKAAECKLEAQELTKLLKATPHAPTPFFAEPGIALARRTDLGVSTMALGPVVKVTAAATTLNGAEHPDPAELGKAAYQLWEKYSPMRERANGPRIYFQIDKATPWSKVVALVRGTTAAGFTTYGFAFSTGAKKPPAPPRSAVDDQLDELLKGPPGGNSAVGIAKLMQGVIAGCGALEKSFREVGSDEGDKAEFMIMAIEEGLIDCNCSVDVPSLRSIMWRILATDPDIQAVSYTTGGAKVAFPGSATWGEVGPKLPKTAAVELVAD